MTTTISRQDMALQLQQEQQQQQQQPRQRSSLLLRNTTNTSNSFANNAINNFNNTTTTTIYPYQFNSTLTPTLAKTATTTATTTICLDSANAIIQIDSLNNNNNNNTYNNNTNNNNNHSNSSLRATTTPTAMQCGLNTINNNGNISPDAELPPGAAAQPKAQKRRSLLNFKSLDLHIKSLYSGLRNGNRSAQSQCSSPGSGNVNGSGLIASGAPANGRAPAVHNRMPPYLKIEAADTEESENLLLDYPQSPYSSRRNSSHDDNRSSSQLLHINRYELSRSPSPSPYFLSPYAMGSGNIRRSSTSDIASGKRSGSSSTSDSRRPSTTDLLRRARERRSSEARMGRSVSHSGLSRGGLGMGGRRKSMA